MVTRYGALDSVFGQAEYAQILSGSGVDVCTIANNHAYDFKQQGLEDTAAALQAENLGVCGFGGRVRSAPGFLSTAPPTVTLQSGSSS